MRSAVDIISTCIFVLFTVFYSVNALRCYKCESVEASSSSTVLNNMIQGKSNPACYPLDTFSVSTTTCPTTGTYKCGLIKGEVSFSVIIFGTFKIKTHIRDCMPIIPGTSDGCKRNEDVTNILNTALSFISSIGNVKLDGDVCYCGTDRCDADGCEGFAFKIPSTSTCISWWVVIGSGGGLVVLLILCCVCCACCCSNSNRGGRVVSVQPQQPNVMVVSVPGQPGYTPGPYQPAPYAQPGMAVVNPAYDMKKY